MMIKAATRSSSTRAKKKGGCLVRHPAYGDRLRRCVAAADVAVDYFFATFPGVFDAAGAFAAAAVFAAASHTLAIFCPLFSMYEP